MSRTNRQSSIVRSILACVLVVVFSLPAATPAEAAETVLYVAPDGLTTGSCASWASACDLQYALSQAVAGSALWVKMGTYYPTGSTDRTVSFVLKNGVELYGGFAGTEITLTRRNPVANVTILSGDIGVPNTMSDNSYHVVIGGVLGARTDHTAILDGFTIRAGNANADIHPNYYGGGMYNESSSPTLANVIFRDNAANYGGGGMYNGYNNGSSDPTLTNVTFIDNSANYGGGGMANHAGNPILINVMFKGNSATDGGGMISGGHPMLTNVTFSGNSATGSGGGMENHDGDPRLTNVTFSENSATSGGGMYNSGSQYGGSPALTDVTFRSNSANDGGGMFNTGYLGNPVLTKVTFSGNSAAYKGGGMFSAGGRPALTDVTFNDNSAGDGGGIYADVRIGTEFTNVTFSGNSAIHKGGGAFSTGSSTALRLTHVIFSDNSAYDGGGMYNYYSDPRLTDVTFGGNSATNWGGGMFNYYSPADSTLTNVTFSGNSANDGGGMFNTHSSPTLSYVTFTSNSATDGGGMFNEGSHPTLTNVTVSSNSAGSRGGGMFNTNSSPTLIDVTFHGNSATNGGGMYNLNGIYYGEFSNPMLTKVTFNSNSATGFGGGMYNVGSPTFTDVTFRGNSATYAGGMYNGGSPTLTNMTFSANSAIYDGGAIHNEGNLTLTNATINGNSAGSGGGMFNRTSGATLTNVTFSANSATTYMGGGIANWYGFPTIRNSILYGDSGGEIVFFSGGSASVSYSIVQGGYAGPGNIDADPLLGPLGNNGGFTQTMALLTGSPAVDAADDEICPAQDQRGVTRPQGAHCDMGAYEAGGVKVMVGGLEMGSYGLEPGESTRQSYANVNNGPVKIVNVYDVPLIAAERLIYKVSGVNTSFTEMMGLPDKQLDTTYWLPWYNNVDLDTQLRFANVSGSPATVNITIGGQPMGDPIQLAAGASTRISFAGVNNGPVKIVSDQNIVAAERLIYRANGKNTSFSEMMALPDKQLDTTYWLPWYNNVDLDTQLRFANVHDTQTAQVHVYIGGMEMQGSPFMLLPGQSTRQSFPGINNGLVQIVSDQNIVAAERLIYKVNGVNTSFTEMMALPASQLNTTYWLPWYNNVDLDTQLRFANVHETQTATVHVYIGGVEMGTGFTLLPGESTRQSFTGINNGPVKIVSNVPIVAAERLIYKVKNVNTSFSEMMALPDSQLDTLYWLPWYNNVDLDTQLRFGVP